jgi:PAS domain S-box-containing protein
MLPEEASVDGLQHLVEHIQDAVAVFELVDGDPIVRGVNEAFIDQFGYSRDAVIDVDLNDRIVPSWLRDEASALDQRTADGEINYRKVHRQTASGLREFLYRGVPYTEADDIVDGYAVYTDLTETTQRERQLKVLNRLLRHNLRNKAAVICGNIDPLLSRIDPAETAAVEAGSDIRKAATALRKLGDEATQINRVLNSDAPAPAVRDVALIVRNVLETFSNRYPSAIVETELPESASVFATSGFHDAVEGLVENAIEHNPADEPRVGVRIAPGPEDGWIDLTVEDDGPIIPAAERDVITGRAEITQTQHGRGLGLWLVKWAVERSGGRLSFEKSDMGGNCVRLRLRTSD